MFGGAQQGAGVRSAVRDSEGGVGVSTHDLGPVQRLFTSNPQPLRPKRYGVFFLYR